MAASSCAAVLACATPELVGPADGPEITRVEVAGNASITDRALEQKLATRASGGLLPFTGQERRLDRAALAQDVRRVKDLYEEAGFYGATVGVRVRPGDDGVAVRFEVEEGRPTRVRTLLVGGLHGLSDGALSYVLEEPALLRGERLVEARWVELKEQLETRLLALGHAEADVQGMVAVSPEEGVADVFVQAEPGPVYRFGDIQVVGNLLVPDRDIRQAAAVAVGRGRRFSPEALEEAQAEVFSLGAFSAVSVTTRDPDPIAGRLPVVIAVREADFLRYRLGAGAGVDDSRQQARVLAGITHLNLFGGLQRLDFDNELAYRFLPSVVNPDRQGFAGSSTLELVQPDLVGTRTDLAIRARYERELTEPFTGQAVSGRLGFPIRLSRWVQLTPSYNAVYWFDIVGVPEIREGRRPSLLSDCPQPCVLSYLEQRLAVDRRDDPVEPRAGWYGALGVQEGGGPLGGSFDWVRLVPDLRGYVPLSADLTLALRLELGWLEPLDGASSPIVSRFFGGGAGGFRGLPAQRLSPLLDRTVTVDGVPERRPVPIGGNSSLLASAELRWYAAERWTLALFTDAGEVESDPLGAFDDPDVQLAAGTGVRYRTPVGPIRLDVAWRFLMRPRYPEGSSVPIEDSALDYFSIFLSIGEAF